MTLWIFYKARSWLWKCSGEPWSTCVSICTSLRRRKWRKSDFGWTSLWWITDVHFNLFTSFWFSSLSALVRLQIAGDDWQIKTAGVKNDCYSLIYLFISQRCNDMPKRKLRFQTVQSEFQMRCNSMENIKCQSQFCTVRREGVSTLRWLQRARVELRRLSSAPVRLLLTFSTKLTKKLKASNQCHSVYFEECTLLNLI